MRRLTKTRCSLLQVALALPLILAASLECAHWYRCHDVPYRGCGRAMQDLIAQRVDHLCVDTPVAMPQIASGTVKPIAILTRGRSPSLPNLASAQEQGLTDFEASNWSAFFLPKDTPAPIVQKLHDATVATMNNPTVRKRFKENGIDLVGANDNHRITLRNSSPAK